MGKGIHQPADSNADDNKEAERPSGVFDAFDRFAAAKRAECERNDQREEQQCLKVGERDVHGRVRLSFRALLRKHAGPRASLGHRP